MGPPAGTVKGPQLTICSVSFHSAPYLDLNHGLVTCLNPAGLVKRWVVVENTPAGEAGTIPAGDPRFKLRPGVEPAPESEKGRASLQHGRALNHAIAGCSTRFLLILDPDFFIVRREWIREAISHMQERGLAFLGAPWHPRWYTKWRYFPCTHCLFIDLQRVSLEDLDFRPDTARQPSAYLSMFLAELEWMSCAGERLRAWRRALRHFRITLEEDRRRRMIIGTSRDTGIQVFDRFARRPGIRHETFLSVYRPREDRLIPPPDVRIDTRSPLREAIERFRPDWMSFVPRRRRYYTRKGFRSFGLPDLHARGWEEFIWRGRPLGFHLRSSIPRAETLEDQVEAVREVIELARGEGPSP